MLKHLYGKGLTPIINRPEKAPETLAKDRGLVKKKIP
jgi:hypothetical protein